MKKTPFKKKQESPVIKREQPAHLAAALKGPRGPKQSPREKLEKSPTSLRIAINAMCYDCNGEENWVNRTRYCSIFKCPLWHVRPHSKNITEQQCLDYDQVQIHTVEDMPEAEDVEE